MYFEKGRGESGLVRKKGTDWKWSGYTLDSFQLWSLVGLWPFPVHRSPLCLLNPPFSTHTQWTGLEILCFSVLDARWFCEILWPGLLSVINENSPWFNRYMIWKIQHSYSSLLLLLLLFYINVMCRIWLFFFSVLCRYFVEFII